jgi:hypothetical protein
MSARRMVLMLFLAAIIVLPMLPRAGSAQEVTPMLIHEAFCRFPFAQVVPLDPPGAWGFLYADVYGRLHLLRWTPKGWVLEWELTNLGTKIRFFAVNDLNADGINEITVATVDGRILVYRMGTYQNLWQNLEDRFTTIEAMTIANVDNDPQLEFIYIADSRLYIVDSVSKSKQWISDRKFDASEIIVDNVDRDPQPEIILNTGVVIDSRFLTVELELDKPFGDRIMTFDMNNDGIPEVIGEASDYSLRIYDVYAKREMW